MFCKTDLASSALQNKDINLSVHYGVAEWLRAEDEITAIF